MIIDGIKYNVGIISVIRKPQVDRIELGTTLDGTKHYLTKGTYYNYEITITTRSMDIATYDALYEVLTDPTTSHLVNVPYGQIVKIIRAKLEPSDDTLIQNYTTLKKWGSLKINVEAIEYEKEAQE